MEKSEVLGSSDLRIPFGKPLSFDQIYTYDLCTLLELRRGIIVKRKNLIFKMFT